MARAKHFPDSDAEVRAGINDSGTGVNLSWRALIGIIAAAVLGATAYMNVVNTANEHSRTLAEHTTSLSELKTDFHSVNAKVDALLVDRGINPRQVLSDAAKK